MASKNSEPYPWHFTEFNNTFQFHGQTTFLIVIFLSFILLIIFLYTYFHFLTRYGHFSAHTVTTTASLSHSQARHIGLDANTINNLPIFMHSSLEKENPNMANFEVKESECSICLGLFEDREIVKVLPICNHVYHSECVDKWLSTQSSCPLCRASLQVTN